MKGQAVNPFSMANANYYDNIIMFVHCHFTMVTPLAGLLSQEFRHTGGDLSLMEPRGDVNQPCFSYTERFIIAGIRHSCSLVSNCIYINRLLRSGIHNTISASRATARRRHTTYGPNLQTVAEKGEKAPTWRDAVFLSDTE